MWVIWPDVNQLTQAWLLYVYDKNKTSQPELIEPSLIFLCIYHICTYEIALLVGSILVLWPCKLLVIVLLFPNFVTWRLVAIKIMIFEEVIVQLEIYNLVTRIKFEHTSWEPNWVIDLTHLYLCLHLLDYFGS